MQRPTLYAMNHCFSKLIWLQHRCIFICKDKQEPYLRDFSTSNKSDIKPIVCVCKFVLDKHYMMQFLLTLDMTSDKLMIDWKYTEAISCCNMVKDRFLQRMCIYHCHWVTLLRALVTKRPTKTHLPNTCIIFFNSINELILALLVWARHKHQLQASVRYVSARQRYSCYVVY